MRAYLSYFKVKVMGGLQYRGAAIAGMATQIFWGLMYCLIYMSFYKSSSTSVDLSQIITYVWLNQAFISLLYVTVNDSELLDSISDGTVAFELLRPYKLYFWWYIKLFASKIAKCILRFLPIIIIGLMMPSPYNLSLPESLLSFVLFIISLLLGTILLCGIIMIIYSISFYTINGEGIGNIVSIIIMVLSGFALPVFLFPIAIQKATYYLPFRLIVDLPFRIYSGNILIPETLATIGLQVIWIIIIMIIGNLIISNSLKKISVQGG